MLKEINLIFKDVQILFKTWIDILLKSLTQLWWLMKQIKTYDVKFLVIFFEFNSTLSGDKTL